MQDDHAIHGLEAGPAEVPLVTRTLTRLGWESGAPYRVRWKGPALVSNTKRT